MRIVSLLPSATELLFAVGAGNEVVGVTHECDFPSEARALPALTANVLAGDGLSAADIDRHIRRSVHAGSSIYALDERLLAELRPDLIVTQELCRVCAVNYEEVEQAVRRLPGDVPVLSLEPGTLDEIVGSAVILGRAIGHEPEALQLQALMERRVAEIASLPPLEPAPRVACIEWTDPVMAGGHWVPGMIEAAGGRDVLGSAGVPSVEVAWERVLEARPEVMVLMPCGFGLVKSLELAADITRRPGFAGLDCAGSGRVAAVDGSSYFNRPGPRIVEGLALLAAILRGEPPAPLPAGASWVPL